MHMYYINSHHVWWLWRSEKGTQSLETGVTEGQELPHGCWELNLGSLQEKQKFWATELFI